MRILCGALVKNEAKKFLPSALKAWGDFSDHIVIIDDNSEDDSAEICNEFGAEVLSSKHTSSMWGSESPLRQQLWAELMHRTDAGDWVFILDADMVPAKNPLDLIGKHNDGVVFPLYDLWVQYSDGRLLYREDNFWQGHLHPRLWMARIDDPKQHWTWNARGIHTGHFPLNLEVSNPVFAPMDYGLLHYAYVDDKLRSAKFKQYLDIAPQLTDFEKHHAQSILDQTPRLKALNFPPKYTLKCES